MNTTKKLRIAERLKYLHHKLAVAEQMKREGYELRKVDKVLDRAIRKIKRKIKRCKKH